MMDYYIGIRPFINTEHEVNARFESSLVPTKLLVLVFAVAKDGKANFLVIMVAIALR